MIDILTKLILLTIRLYPTGRAFEQPVGGTRALVNEVLAESERDVYNFLTAILDEILADNDDFTEEDASTWERRLNILASSSTSLEDRKAAIRRKYASPGDQLNRGYYLYLQNEIQTAGFTDVYIHENRFDDGMGGLETRTPDELGYPATIQDTFGDDEAYFGGIAFGQGTGDVIANFVDQDRDNQFVVSSDLRATFYVGGEVIGTVADVPEDRRTELRQLILQIKPLQTVGLIYINYT